MIDIIQAFEACRRESNSRFGEYRSARLQAGEGELVIDSSGGVGFVARTNDGYRGASTDAERAAVFAATVAIAAYKLRL